MYFFFYTIFTYKAGGADSAHDQYMALVSNLVITNGVTVQSLRPDPEKEITEGNINIKENRGDTKKHKVVVVPEKKLTRNTTPPDIFVVCCIVILLQFVNIFLVVQGKLDPNDGSDDEDVQFLATGYSLPETPTKLQGKQERAVSGTI